MRNGYMAACGVICLAASLCPADVVTEETKMRLPNARGILEELNGDAEGRTLLYAGIVTAFREVASDKPKAAVDFYFSDKAKQKWDLDIAPELDAIALADFFTAGILLSGPQDKSAGIVGVYNPWWDAILLLKLSPKVKGAEQSPHVEVVDFHLFSGETFREEPVEKDETAIRRVTVVPENDPISAEVWRVTSATRKRFEATLPLEGTVTFSRLNKMIVNRDRKREMDRIAVRAGLRLKLTMQLLKNGKAMGHAMLVKKMTRDGNVLQLYSFFKEPGSRDMLRTFSEVPEMFRKDFEVYGYVPTKAAALYVAVNKKMPRLYVTATIPADVPKTPASFEWYDLTQADALLDAWNSRAEKGDSEKEASK